MAEFKLNYTGEEVQKKLAEPSWNDLTGKPFYEETSTVEVLAEGEATILDSQDEISQATLPLSLVLNANETYMVTYNGTEYTCIAQDFTAMGEGAVGLGDFTAQGLAGNGEPFTLMYAPTMYSADGYSGIVMANDGNKINSISIYHHATVIHPIEGKFLPKGTPWIEEGGGTVEVLGETAFSKSDATTSVEYKEPIDIVAGETYIVTWNGVEYTVVAFALNNGYVTVTVLGDYSGEFPELLSATGEPFGIIRYPDEAVSQLGGRYGFIRPNEYPNEAYDFTISIERLQQTIHKIDRRCLLDGIPYVQENILLAEANATSITHPTFGQMWAVYGGVPYLKAGETYTITYNGTDYKCVCQAAPAGLIDDPNAVAMGNFSAVGGENTGEPFGMLISYDYQEVDIIDLVGSTEVKVKIGSTDVRKLDERCLPGSMFVTVDLSTMTASKNCNEILAAMMNNQNVFMDFGGAGSYGQCVFCIKDEGAFFISTSISKTDGAITGFTKPYFTCVRADGSLLVES